MRLESSFKNAVATRFDWNAPFGSTVWFTIEGMGDNRMPVLVSNEQMHKLASGNRRAQLQICIVLEDENT